MNPVRILWSPESISEGTGVEAELVTLCRSELEEFRNAVSLLKSIQAGESTPGSTTTNQSNSANLSREDALSLQLAERERQSRERESAYREAIRDRELATSLAGRPLVQGAVSQLMKLWQEEFEACEEGGTYRIVARDGRPVSQAITELLARPEFAHFCQPSSRGGVSPARSVQTASPASNNTPVTLGERIIQHWREAAREAAGQIPVGLKRRV